MYKFYKQMDTGQKVIGKSWIEKARVNELSVIEIYAA